MKLNIWTKAAMLAVVVGGATACLGTGASYEYTVDKTGDDSVSTPPIDTVATPEETPVTFAQVKAILETPSGANTKSCLNCHGAVGGKSITVGAGSATVVSSVIKDGASGDFLMAEINPALLTDYTGSNLADMDPDELAAAATWNCNQGDRTMVKHTTSSGAFKTTSSIRTEALSRAVGATNPYNSKLLGKIGGTTEGTRMPKSGTGVTDYLDEESVELIRRWVAQGAPCT